MKSKLLFLLCFFSQAYNSHSQGYIAPSLPQSWIDDISDEYTGIERVLRTPLSEDWLSPVRMRYLSDPSHKFYIENLTKHLKMPDSPKKQINEKIAVNLFLKDYLNRTPQDVILLLLFGIQGDKNETLAQYLQRNKELLAIIASLDSIKKLEASIQEQKNKIRYSS